MFINNLDVAFKVSNILEAFLFCIAKQNNGVFFNYEVGQELSIDIDQIESFIPKNNLAVSEEYLQEVLKSEFIDLSDKDDNYLMSNTQKLVRMLHSIASENTESLNDNILFYKRWWLNAKVNSIKDVPYLIERESSETISSIHRDLITNSKKVIIIPSLYVYPQVGFNFIDDTAYILIGLSKSSNRQQFPLDTIAQGFKALGEAKRLEIINIIGNSGGIQSKDIAQKIKLTPATVSHHLNTLVQAGIVSRQRNGRDVRFILESSRIDFLTNYLKSNR